jgi:uncharacterized membrane protein required for colicin V production
VAVWPTAGGGRGLDVLVLLTLAVFGVIGFVRGARREVVSFAVTVAAYVALELFWPTVAALVNAVLGLVTAGPPIPPGDAAVWQIVVFVAVVLGGYLLSQVVGRFRLGGAAAVVRLPDWIERLIGACLGVATGYLVARFVVSRLLPSAVISITGPGSTVGALVERVGPIGLFVAIGLFILFGVLSLGGRKKQVYG